MGDDSIILPPLPDPWRLSIKLGDAIMWAFGTTEAIDRLDATYVGKFKYKHKSPGNPQVRQARLISHYYEFNAVWAANHLVSAFRRLPKPIRGRVSSTSADMLKVVEALRDVLEHWENNRGPEGTGALPKLRSADPDAAAWTSQWSLQNGLTLANSLHVPQLHGWADDVRSVCESEFDSIAEELFPPD